MSVGHCFDLSCSGKIRYYKFAVFIIAFKFKLSITGNVKGEKVDPDGSLTHVRIHEDP